MVVMKLTLIHADDGLAMNTVHIATITLFSRLRRHRQHSRLKVRTLGLMRGKSMLWKPCSVVDGAKTCRMIKDDRARQKEFDSIFDVGESADRLG